MAYWTPIPSGLLSFGLIKRTLNGVLKVTPSEKKNSPDALPALTYLF
jgi:hypothetical protein